MATQKKPLVRRKSPAHKSQNRVLQQTGVYLMHNIPCFWRNKFGISDHLKRRQSDVSESSDGFVFAILSPRLEFGYELEQFVHGMYAFANCDVKKGSGRTEWFYTVNPVCFVILCVCHFRFGFDIPLWAYALGVFSPFVWLDGVLWLIVFSVFRLIVAALIFLAGLYVLSHM